MSKQRYIDTKFWDDNYIIECDSSEKLLYLYLLTNPLTNISGIYEISLRRISFDTGIDKETLIKILEKFEDDNKGCFRVGGREMLIKTWTEVGCNLCSGTSFIDEDASVFAVDAFVCPHCEEISCVEDGEEWEEDIVGKGIILQEKKNE